MRIAIIQFPGSNCERETILAVKRSGMQPEEFLWNRPSVDLKEFDGFVIVGGFSYEDRGRSGVIAALDPIMLELKKQSKVGKPILGICNGAQILVESGLVPGLENDKIGMALTDNKRIKDNQVLATGYYNAWIKMRLANNYQLNAFTKNLSNKDILSVPIAHAEGRFVIPPALLKEMQNNGQCVFQYCDSSGEITDEFPVNPNGSVDNIAAVSNKSGNVLAMMPHPERTTNGDDIFKSMHDYIKQAKFQLTLPLHYYHHKLPITKYKTTKKELLIETLITDNNVLSVEKAINNYGLDIKIKRYIHFEIDCDNFDDFEMIKSSGVIFNDRKEKIIDISRDGNNKLLVRSKDDMYGLHKFQTLKNHFNIDSLKNIHHSILWSIESDDKISDKLINTNILFNPYAHVCYYY
ncbi:phosphoribosylformylglycinamidine synthase I [Gammaproteobacteria bacterium]|nr:phosphoribosylformylglycinamidine synthase I [Gammaproteobacteria bacterium]